MLFRFFYTLFFPLGFLIGAPFYALRMWKRGRAWDKLEEHWGVYSEALQKKIADWGDARPIWIHAVSVGEVKLAQALIEQLRAVRPQQTVVLSTTTQTGRKLAKSLEDDRLAVVYNPFDFPWVVRRAFAMIRPTYVVLVEGEIWPQILWHARTLNVPVCLINARLSDRSWKRYRLFGRWLAPLLDHFLWIGIQHESECVRFAQAGFPPHKLFVTGSMKFQVSRIDTAQTLLADELRQKLGWENNEPVLLAGSTCLGEEEMILRTYKALKPRFTNLRLVLVPRHDERTREVTHLIDRFHLSMMWRSALKDSSPPTAPDVLLVDTTGELNQLYPLGTVVIIGRSLVDQGGSNFVEPAQFSKPVIVGPYMSNFASVVGIFLDQNALVSLSHPNELTTKVEQLLADDSARQAFGQRARTVFDQHQGATQRTVELILA